MPDLKAYCQLLRPRQWLKNMMLYFPPFLGGTLLQPGVALRGVRPFAAFCLASSAIYVLNDLCDSANDSRHPKKRLRPLPSGRISPRGASALAVGCALCSVMLAWGYSGAFLFYLAAYGTVSIAYSLYLKDLALVDLFCISSGFLFRLLAGGVVFGAGISEWLFLSVFLLSIFLSTGKRLGEKGHLGVMAEQHRKVLVAYPEGFLEGTMYLTGGAVLVTYTMYVLSRPSGLLIHTVPLCCFGLLRHMLRIQSGADGDPTESLTRDVPLFVVGTLWLIMVGWGIYAT